MKIKLFWTLSIGIICLSLVAQTGAQERETIPPQSFGESTIDWKLYTFSSKRPASWSAKFLGAKGGMAAQFWVNQGSSQGTISHPIYAQLGFGRMSNPKKTLQNWMVNRLRPQILSEKLAKKGFSSKVVQHKQGKTSAGDPLDFMRVDLSYRQGPMEMAGKSVVFGYPSHKLINKGGEKTWQFFYNLKPTKLKGEKIFVITNLFLNGKSTGFYQVKTYNIDRYAPVYRTYFYLPQSKLLSYSGASTGVFELLVSVYAAKNMELFRFKSYYFQLNNTWGYYSQFKDPRSSRSVLNGRKTFRLNYSAFIKGYPQQNITLGATLCSFNGKTLTPEIQSTAFSPSASYTGKNWNFQFYQDSVMKLLGGKLLPVNVILTMRSKAGTLLSTRVVPLEIHNPARTILWGILLQGKNTHLLLGTGFATEADQFLFSLSLLKEVGNKLGKAVGQMLALATQGTFSLPPLQPQLARSLIRKGEYFWRYTVSISSSYSSSSFFSEKWIRWTFYSDQTCTIRGKNFSSFSGSSYMPGAPGADAYGNVNTGNSYSRKSSSPITRRPFEIRGYSGGPYWLIIRRRDGGLNLHPFDPDGRDTYGPYTPRGVSIDGWVEGLYNKGNKYKIWKKR